MLFFWVMPRKDRIEELIRLIKMFDIDVDSPYFAIFIYRYLKTRYGFTDQTIYDYIKTIRMKLKRKATIETHP